jgi:hypothetical protein
MQSLKQMHLESLNLILNSQSSKRDKWEGVCSAQRKLSQVRMTKRVSKDRLMSLYRRPKKIESLSPSLCWFSYWPDSLQYDWTCYSSVPSQSPVALRATQRLTVRVSVPSDQTRRSLDRICAHLEFGCKQRGSRDDFYRSDASGQHWLDSLQ